MSIFKKIPKDDVAISPYTAHKKYTLLIKDFSGSFNGLEAADIYVYESKHAHSFLKDAHISPTKYQHIIIGNEFTSGSEIETTNNFAKRSVHDSLQHMYYNSVRDLSNTFCAEPNFNEYRELNGSAQVMSIPQRMFGDKIHASDSHQTSVRIVSGSVDATGSINLMEIRDDGNGNLYDLEAGGLDNPLSIYQSMTGSLVLSVGFNEHYKYHQKHVGAHCPAFPVILEDKSRYATDTRGHTLFFNTGSKSHHGTGLMLAGKRGANIYDNTRWSYFRAKKHQNIDFRKDEDFALSFWCNLPTSQSDTTGYHNYIMTSGQGDHYDYEANKRWRSRFPFDVAVYNQRTGLKERWKLTHRNSQRNAHGMLRIFNKATHSASDPTTSPSESVFIRLQDALGTRVDFYCTTQSGDFTTQATYPTISFHGAITSSATLMASQASARINQGILFGYTASGNPFPLLISASAKESQSLSNYGAALIFSQSIAGRAGNVIGGTKHGVNGSIAGNNTFNNGGSTDFAGGDGPYTPAMMYTGSYLVLTTRGQNYGGPTTTNHAETGSYERHVFYWSTGSTAPPILHSSSVDGITTHSTTVIDLGAPTNYSSGSHDSFAIASKSFQAITSHPAFTGALTAKNFPYDGNQVYRFWDLYTNKGTGVEYEVTPSTHGNVPQFRSASIVGPFFQSAVNGFDSQGGVNTAMTFSAVQSLNGRFGQPGQILARRSDGINLFQVSSSTMVTESWNHVLYQKSGSMLELYVNNNLECRLTASDEGQCKNNDDLYFGVATRMTASGKFKKNDAGDIFINRNGQPAREMVREYMRPISGALDEIRLYDKALNADQRKLLYNCPNGTPFIGNVFYEHGLIVVTHPSQSQDSEGELVRGKYSGLLSECTLSFKNTYEIQEHEYTLNIKRGEYNFTMNSSILEKSKEGNRESKIASFVTDTPWSPYISTVGLYNDAGQLLVVGKLSRALKKEDAYDTTIVVRYDT